MDQMVTRDDAMSKVQLDGWLTQIRSVPGDWQRHQECARVLLDLHRRRRLPPGYQPVICDLLEYLYRGGLVSYQDLAPLAVDQLKLKHRILSRDLDLNPALVTSLARDYLCLTLLEKTINTDLALEQLVTRLRRYLLLDREPQATDSDLLLGLAAALAQQGFNNEYVLLERQDERLAVDAIGKSLDLNDEKSLTGNALPLLVWGMYRPLLQLPSAHRIAEITLGEFPSAARPAIVKMLHEPLVEKRLANEIPSFGKIARRTSQAVRNQYEENPYPRWFELAGSCPSLKDCLAVKRPGFSWSAALGSSRLQVLAAGCGTGLQPLATARANPDADVLAIDLSKPSLGFGQRMAYQLGIRNVTFRHGDLLEISELGKRFHHIECLGVLHHLRNPAAGWRALEQALLPGGTLLAGVYSLAARLPVEYLRGEIDRLGLEPKPDAMRKFRSDLLHNDKYRSLRQSLSSYDFYSLSSFRDLLFHVEEHCYTLAQIAATIDDLGLEFLGFEITTPALRAKYRQQFPEDPHLTSFANWRRFETSYAGQMTLFYLWLMKPATRS